MHTVGSAQGSPIVLLHAIAVSSPLWFRAVDALGEHHPVYALDTLGDAGRSAQTVPIDDGADTAAWLEDVLAKLDLTEVHLVGLSYGGWLALNQAHRSGSRLKSVTAIDPPSAFGIGHVTPMLANCFVLFVRCLLRLGMRASTRETIGPSAARRERPFDSSSAPGLCSWIAAGPQRRSNGVATITSSHPDAAAPVRKGHRGARPTAETISLGVLGVGLAIIVGFAGSPLWCIVRVLVVGAVVSRAMRLTRRDSTLGSATVLACLAFVGAVGGAAIAFSFLTTTGLTLRALGGVLAAAGGAVLFVLAVADAVRRMRGWRKVLTFPVVAILAYAIGFPVAMSAYATNVGRPALGRTTPADRGFAYQDARFRSSDGVSLSGWYIPSRNRAAVVLLHGASSTRSSVLEQAAVLAHHGYGVLLFDARGMGHSDGRAMDFGWYGDQDVTGAVDYLARQPDVDPARIGAVGESMGGEEAIGAMAHDPRIHVVVAEGATNRVSGDWAWLSDSYGARGYAQRGVLWFTTQLTDLLTAAHAPTTLRDAVAHAAPRPVLLIAAGNIADEVNADRAIQRASPNSVDVWVAPRASHTGALRAAPNEWTTRVTAFLDAVLRAGR